MRSRGRGWIAVQGQASWAVARRPPITHISDPFECMAEGTLRRPWVLQWLLFSRPAGVPAPSARSRRVDRVFRGNLWTRGGPSGGRRGLRLWRNRMLQASGCVVEHSDRSGWIKYQSVHVRCAFRKAQSRKTQTPFRFIPQRNKTKTQPQLAHTTNCACPPETCPLPHCRSSRADVCRTVECCNHAHGTVNQSAGWSRWLDAGWAQFGHAGRTPTAHAGLC